MNAYRIPFLPGHRMAVVEVRFGTERTADLLVDTGAERTVIVPRLAQRLELDLESPAGRVELQGVGGRQRAPICRVDRLAIGAVLLPQHEVVVADVTRTLVLRSPE